MSRSAITPAELASRLSADPALNVIDVRGPAEFAAVHAPAARNLPLGDLAPEAVATDKAAPVFILCHSGRRAELAADKLAAAGFREPVVVTGGTEAWSAAGLPVVRGVKTAISIERQVRIGAGSLVLGGVLLSHFAHPGFVWLSGFVGAGLVFAGVTDFCGMGILLSKAPWNR